MREQSESQAPGRQAQCGVVTKGQTAAAIRLGCQFQGWQQLHGGQRQRQSEDNRQDQHHRPESLPQGSPRKRAGGAAIMPARPA